MIVVNVKNEILGDSEFWRGPESKISEISNIPAQELAKQVAKDGITRTMGMWTVQQVPDQKNEIPNYCAVTIDDDKEISWSGEGNTPDEAFNDLIENGDFDSYCEHMEYDRPEPVEIKIYTCIDIKDSDWPEEERNPKWVWCLDQHVETRIRKAVVVR